MEILRTPDDRFSSLPDFAYAPRYTNVDGLRMHYVDEGDSSASPVLLLHGEPSWAYLYRRMIPTIVEAGHRAVAPDLIGFGRSDKPADRGAYTYERHVAWMAGAIANLDLRNITLVCQDWGSLIGLRVAAEDPDRFERIVVANGGLPTGQGSVPLVFRLWRSFARYSPWFPIGRIVAAGTRRRLMAEERAAYDAPFPDERYKQGARAFPALVPTTPDDPAVGANRLAWETLSKWEKPFLTAFSDSDPITRRLARPLQERIPGARGRQHPTIRAAGHFLQEDKGPELAQVVVDFIAAS